MTKKLTRTVHGFLVLLIASIFIGFGLFIIQWLDDETIQQQTELTRLNHILMSVRVSHENMATLSDLKEKDLATFKLSLETQALSKKDLFESGVMLHDEKRLLEKQWDIMTTSLLVDEDPLKIKILKSEEPVESFVMLSSPTVVGVFDSSSPLKIQNLVRITSKERFAHPERGKAETVNGVLQWVPPQVGTSVRANALGEFVIFTDNSLIIHGPPAKPEDHANYPHFCLPISKDTARKLYQQTYIGTKISLVLTKPMKYKNEK